MRTKVSVLTWMSTSPLLERESGNSLSMTRILTCNRGGGIGTNTSGDTCQMTDQNSESGRIKAFINNEINGVPMHLVIGEPCRHRESFQQY